MDYRQDDGLLTVEVYAQDNLTDKLIKEGIWIDTADVLKDFKDNTDIKDIVILIAMPLVDVYGKKTTDVEVNMTFSYETRKKINWNNFIFNNIPNVADVYIEHPVMQKIKT